MTSFSLDQLEIFFGELTVNRAHIYARLPRGTDDAGLSLAGQVRGPRCLHAETLPATSPLVDLGSGPTLLARAVVPDPCFWSPDLPAIYDVSVNLLRGSEVVASERREIGLRSLGVRGTNLLVEGKRFVLRGVRQQSSAEKLPRDWHAASAALYISQPTNEVLLEASQWGALILAELAEQEDAVAAIARLSQYPAVAIAVLRGNRSANLKPSARAPNLLFAQRIDKGNDFELQPWAQLMIVDAADATLVAQVAATSQTPIIVLRTLATPAPIHEARAACDLLQRDLAHLGQFAGYIV